MTRLHFNRLSTVCLAGAITAAVTLSAQAAPNYSISDVLVPPDQYSGEGDLTPADVYKPHLMAPRQGE